MKIENLKNKKIAILGFGKEGKSTKNFLEKLDIKDFEILDKKDNPNYLENLERFDIIFKSPGISPYNNPELLKVKEKLTSQAEILADNFEGKIIGITGTKGKSTTSTLVFEILKEFGYKVKLVGNIGNPVFDEIDILGREKYDFIVYELSSFMLEGLNLNIFIGLLNNIYDCHLDWHNGRKNYEIAKFNIFKNAKNKLVNYELEKVIENKKDKIFFGLGGKYFYKDNAFFIDGKKIINDENIALNGEHNRKNISGVLAILDIILKNENKNIFDEKNIERIKNILKKFNGLEHRQENIGTYKGITFINDSIASTPESSIAAIKTFGYKIGTIFIGNEDSGFNLNELKNIIKKYNIKNIVLFPETGEKLFGDFSKNMDFEKETKFIEDNFETNLYKTLSMENAVKFAYKNSNKGEIVLLSTGAPSFNANGIGKMPWKSYIEKGNIFKEFVVKYGK